MMDRAGATTLIMTNPDTAMPNLNEMLDAGVPYDLAMDHVQVNWAICCQFPAGVDFRLLRVSPSSGVH